MNAVRREADLTPVKGRDKRSHFMKVFMEEVVDNSGVKRGAVRKAVGVRGLYSREAQMKRRRDSRGGANPRKRGRAGTVEFVRSLLLPFTRPTARWSHTAKAGGNQ